MVNASSSSNRFFVLFWFFVLLVMICRFSCVDIEFQESILQSKIILPVLGDKLNQDEHTMELSYQIETNNTSPFLDNILHYSDKSFKPSVNRISTNKFIICLYISEIIVIVIFTLITSFMLGSSSGSVCIFEMGDCNY